MKKGKWYGHTSSSVRDKYNKKTYDAVTFRVLKGGKDLIQQAASGEGMSMTEYICNALSAYGCTVSSKQER